MEWWVWSWSVVGTVSTSFILGAAITFAASSHPMLADSFFISGLFLLAAKFLSSDEFKGFGQKNRQILRPIVVSSWILLAGFGVLASRRLSAPTATDQKVDRIYDWINNKDEQEMWLKQFPLGYTIFDVNAVSRAVSPPYLTHQGPELYEFDVRPVQILTNTSRHIEIQLPDVLRDGKPLLTKARVGGDKTTMQMYGAGYIFSDGDTAIMGTAQVLQYVGNRVYWIFGLRRVPAPHPSTN